MSHDDENGTPIYSFAADGRRGPKKKKYEKGDKREPVILRTRMRRGLLMRLKAIVAHDREVLQENWNLSDAVREVLMGWVELREAEIRAAAAAQFTGTPPEEDEDDVAPATTRKAAN
jgi:hypothetical protein